MVAIGLKTISNAEKNRIHSLISTSITASLYFIPSMWMALLLNGIMAFKFINSPHEEPSPGTSSLPESQSSNIVSSTICSDHFQFDSWRTISLYMISSSQWFTDTISQQAPASLHLWTNLWQNYLTAVDNNDWQLKAFQRSLSLLVKQRCPSEADRFLADIMLFAHVRDRESV